ncbi:MAG TPA: hypothetical protein DIT89_16525 [Planctomycetaceae bacterium]|nr:hypothetical protein [Planctomycetaceae bacterium]
MRIRRVATGRAGPRCEGPRVLRGRPVWSVPDAAVRYRRSVKTERQLCGRLSWRSVETWKNCEKVRV